MDFPGNSHTARQNQNTPEQEPAKTETTSETRQVKKVVSGKVTKRDEPLGKRFKKMFISGSDNFAEHLLENVIVPRMKDMALGITGQMVDAFRQGVEEMLFGPNGRSDQRRTTSYGTGRPTRINYSSYSATSTVRRSTDRPERDRGPIIRRSNRVKEIIVESREDGDAVIEELDAMIDSIGHCTVGDFYAAVGEGTRSTDEEWGWTSLKEARVHQIDREGREFLISMPSPRPIES